MCTTQLSKSHIPLWTFSCFIIILELYTLWRIIVPRGIVRTGDGLVDQVKEHFESASRVPPRLKTKQSIPRMSYLLTSHLRYPRLT
jgi:hypothetical protein